MRAKSITITYMINGATKVNTHRDQTVAYAVRNVSRALHEIDKEGGHETRSRILKVEAEY